MFKNLKEKFLMINLLEDIIQSLYKKEKKSECIEFPGRCDELSGLNPFYYILTVDPEVHK